MALGSEKSWYGGNDGLALAEDGNEYSLETGLGSDFTIFFLGAAAAFF